MSLDKQMDELERHLDYAKSYFDDVRSEFASTEGEYLNIIATLNDETDTLREVNDDLAGQVAELNRKLAIFELENMELRLRIEVYELEV